MRERLELLRQRGSILAPAALIILLALILLGGAQLGYFYYVKRELQKAVDLAALTGAQMLEQGTRLNCELARTAAEENVRQNLPAYRTRIVVPAPECYRWAPDDAALAPRFVRAADTREKYNAVRVQVSMPVMAIFPFMVERTLHAEAIASRPGEPVAAFWVGTSLVRTRDGVLTDLLRQVGLDLRGTGLVGYESGLALAKITPSGLLRQLGIEVPANISVGDFNRLLAANTRALGDVLDAVVTLAGRGELLSANAGLLNTIRAKLGVQDLKVQLGSPTEQRASALFAYIAGPDVGSALNVQLNALDVLAAAIGVGTGNHAVTVGQTVDLLGLLQVQARARVIEPPSISIGGVGARAYTAQVRVFLHVTTPKNGLRSLLGGLVDLHVDLPITLDVVSGDATITQLCEARDAQGRDLARVRADSSLLRVCVGGPPVGANGSWPFSTGFHCGDGFARQDLLRLSVLGTSLAKLSVDKLQVPALAVSAEADFYAGQQRSLPEGGNSLPVGTTVKQLTDALLGALVGSGLQNGSTVNQPELRAKLAQQIWADTRGVCSGDSAACRGERLKAALQAIDRVSHGLSGFLGSLTGNTLDLLGSLLTLNVAGLLQSVGGLVGNLLGLVTGLLDGLVGGVLGTNTCSGWLAGSESGCLRQLENVLAQPASAPALGNPPNAVVALVGFLVELLRPVLDAIGARVLQPLLNDLLGLQVGMTDVSMQSINCDGPGVQLVY